MVFKYKDLNGDVNECAVEVYSNDDGIVVKFLNSSIEPKANEIINYVFVDAGYGYISLKRKNEDAILSGLLKKEFFSHSMMIEYAIDFVVALMPEAQDAHIPYNFEQIIVVDSHYYTGEDAKSLGDKSYDLNDCE